MGRTEGKYEYCEVMKKTFNNLMDEVFEKIDGEKVSGLDVTLSCKAGEFRNANVDVVIHTNTEVLCKG